MPNKILVVDDEKQIRVLLKKTFDRAGIDATLVENAEKALEIVQNERFDVFFLDINLPGMNGLELCEKLKKDHPTSFFFAITGYASVFDLVKCREAGFDDYFIKPFAIESVIRVAKDAMNKLDRWRKSNS